MGSFTKSVGIIPYGVVATKNTQECMKQLWLHETSSEICALDWGANLETIVDSFVNIGFFALNILLFRIHCCSSRWCHHHRRNAMKTKTMSIWRSLYPIGWFHHWNHLCDCWNCELILSHWNVKERLYCDSLFLLEYIWNHFIDTYTVVICLCACPSQHGCPSTNHTGLSSIY